MLSRLFCCLLFVGACAMPTEVEVGDAAIEPLKTGDCFKWPGAGHPDTTLATRDNALLIAAALQNEPYLGFYRCDFLRTTSGSVIGSFCLPDDNSRAVLWARNSFGLGACYSDGTQPITWTVYACNGATRQSCIDDLVANPLNVPSSRFFQYAQVLQAVRCNNINSIASLSVWAGTPSWAPGKSLFNGNLHTNMCPCGRVGFPSC